VCFEKGNVRFIDFFLKDTLQKFSKGKFQKDTFSKGTCAFCHMRFHIFFCEIKRQISAKGKCAFCHLCFHILFVKCKRQISKGKLKVSKRRISKRQISKWTFPMKIVKCPFQEKPGYVFCIRQMCVLHKANVCFA